MIHNLTHATEMQRELSLYQGEKSAHLESDPLDWWLAQEQLYSLMSKLVKQVFVLSLKVFHPSGFSVPVEISLMTSVVAFYLRMQTS